MIDKYNVSYKNIRIKYEDEVFELKNRIQLFRIHQEFINKMEYDNNELNIAAEEYRSTNNELDLLREAYELSFGIMRFVSKVKAREGVTVLTRMYNVRRIPEPGASWWPEFTNDCYDLIDEMDVVLSKILDEK